MTTPIRVLIADDQPLLRASFTTLINSTPDLHVVGEAGTGHDAIDRTRTTGADVVLMDIRMPDLDGLTATRRITTDAHLAHVKVLILTTFEIDEYVFEALRSGASGFLGKSAEPGDLLDAIRIVHRGDALLSPAATRSLISRYLARPDHGLAITPTRLDRLTEREREILTLVGTGLSNDDIAGHLTVSPHTVKTHVNRTMTKLDAHDRAQLVVIAYETGLVRPVRP
ncbi:response regulator transcription factor [Couchioplanes caeruleus]|uniref:DNA-binding response regulator n=2 Tax=Couchioplanes caeruleus TaxID=56438 RepID=A0A1K0G7Z3_9ACTN|nr:response regulator transcription factor [Couchioplanes caeruleus]OJF13362.1 DNA-binding response regulator [Couchioplanes caeruleus subsp. caeruleus]ROP33573.1 LuxR family two component transcriptional regulator [Couchioplanes caeruleus]